MEIPNDIFFYKTNEYIRPDADDIYIVGISEKLADELGTISHIVFPETDAFYYKKEVFAFLESQDAAEEIHLPVNGVIIQINPALYDNPSLINEDPYGQGWLIKVKAPDYDEDKFDFINVQDYFGDN